MTIATRAAAAKPEETAGLLWELKTQIAPKWFPITESHFLILGNLNTPESLIAAVMMLDDSGFDLRRTMDGTGSVDLYPKGFLREPIVAHAATPALAFIAAIAASRGV